MMTKLNGSVVRLPAGMLGGVGSRVQSHAGARRDLIHLQTGVITKNLHCLLVIICHPIRQRLLRQVLYTLYTIVYAFCRLHTQKVLPHIRLSHP